MTPILSGAVASGDSTADLPAGFDTSPLKGDDSCSALPLFRLSSAAPFGVLLSEPSAHAVLFLFLLS